MKLFSPRPARTAAPLPLVWCLAFLAIFAIAQTRANATPEWQSLFNGQDFSGWESFMGTPLSSSNLPGAAKDAKGNYTEPLGLDNDLLKTFTIVLEDGSPAIRLSGEGYGVLSTKQTYANYHLRFQFKWGEKRYSPADKPRNGGLMYHAHGTYGELNGRWMNALQYQISEGTCGDFIVMGDSSGRMNATVAKPGATPLYDPSGAPVTISIKADNKGRCTRSENFELPHGQWNTCEIICLNDTVIQVINGHVVARVDHLRYGAGSETGGGEVLTSGFIQLQLEMAEMFYRDIELREISESPAEFAAQK